MATIAELIAREEKRIADPLTDEEQKEVSRQNIEKLKNTKQTKPLKSLKTVKKNREDPLEATRQNMLNSMAAYTPNMSSTKDASLAGNPEVVEAEKLRNEAKLADARNAKANDAAVANTEQLVQDAVAKAKDPELQEGEPSDEAVAKDPELQEGEPDEAVAKSEIEEQIASGNNTPQGILEGVADKYGFSLLKFDENGRIIVPDLNEESQWKRADTAGKLAMIGTVLSCIVSALSGGNIPPINFNKIVGLDKQYTTYLANIHQFNEAIASGLKQEAGNVANADFASYTASLPENERRILENISSDYEYTKSIADQERLKTQGKVSRDLINAQASSAVNYLISLQDAYNKGLITDKTFNLAVEKARADMGEWSGLWERITDRAGIEGGLTASGQPYGGAKVGK